METVTLSGDVAVEDEQLQRAENQRPRPQRMKTRASLTIDARNGGGDGLSRPSMTKGVSTRGSMFIGVSTRGSMFIGGNDIGEEKRGHSALCVLAVGAFGVVFGDIGTSPLYTLKTITHNIPIFEGDDLEAVNRSEIIVAVYCLIFYTLIWVVSFKYVLWVMKVNHEGNGGSLAMAQVIMANLPGTSLEKKDSEDESDPTTTPPAVGNSENIKNSASHQRKTMAVMTLAIVSTCLLVSDGIITPPNTILGALDTPVLGGISTNVNVLISVVILLITFGVQKFGSKTIGVVFGPVMILWFASLAFLGILAISRYPEEARFLSRAFNPACLTAFTGTAENPPIVGFRNAFFSFSGVILCVSGAEALYADLGHFGYKAITLAWTLVVLPALAIQYYGQCCYVISLGRDTSLYPSSDHETVEYQALLQERQLFNTKLIEVPNDMVYALVPTDVMSYMAGQACLWLLTIIAVLAAIIASQSLISGLFSVLTQAYALDLVPRLTISHTNPDEKGQVYISEANTMMCVVCILIVLVFQTSEALLSAYGIAVALCMFLTDLSMGMVMTWVYKYHWAVAVLVCVPFIFVDGLFVSSNCVKLSQGVHSWLTIIITGVLWFFMQAHWWTKSTATRAAQVAHAQVAQPTDLTSNQKATTMDIDNLLSLLKDSKLIKRMPVAGVFLTNLPKTPPLSLSIFARSMASIPETIILLNISLSHAKPFVSERERFDLHCHSEELGVYSLTMYFGYCEPITADYFDLHDSIQEIFDSEGYIALEKLTEETSFHRKLRESTRFLMMPNDEIERSPGSAHRWTYILGVRHYVPHAKESVFAKIFVNTCDFLTRNSKPPRDFFGLSSIDADTIEITSLTTICSSDHHKED